jgi:ATP-dependent DNA helicase 2 subunit 1
MLERPPHSDDKKAERDSPTTAALKCAYQLMQQRIISNPKDMMGILLFGTEQTDLRDGDSTFQHCYLLSDLDVPSAQDVKQLRDLLEDDEEAAKILKPAKEPASIATVLFPPPLPRNRQRQPGQDQARQRHGHNARPRSL